MSFWSWFGENWEKVTNVVGDVRNQQTQNELAKVKMIALYAVIGVVILLSIFIPVLLIGRKRGRR